MSGYDRELVERLIPAVWDDSYAYGMSNPYEPAPDMPRSKPDPKIGGTIFAHLADIRIAWQRADVPQVQRQALLLRFGLDWTVQDVATNQGTSKSTAHERIEQGVGRLVAYLNGKTYQDYEDGDGDSTPECASAALY